MSRHVYVINDIFQQGEEGRRDLHDFAEEHLPGVKVDGFLFDRTGDMKDQVVQAVEAAIASDCGVVVLDVYFGTLGERADRLGIDVALPRLVEAEVPTVVVSELDDAEVVVENILDAQLSSRVLYLPARKAEFLSSYVAMLLEPPPTESASEEFGFKYRLGDEIQVRRRMEGVFDQHAKEIGSVPLDLPLIAPVSNFLGAAPRPLPEKASNKLFMAVTSDGRAMAARYEGTALTAKLVAEHVRTIPDFGSEIFHYFQEMVRVETSSDLDEVHFRSFYQAGIEAFAVNAEEHQENVLTVVAFTLRYLRALEFEPKLRFSHVGLIPSVLAMPMFGVLDKFGRRRLIGAMEKGGLEEVNRTAESCGLATEATALLCRLSQLRRLPLLDGIDGALSLLPWLENELEALTSLAKGLKTRRLLQDCLFDPGIYRSLDFYSGITFQGGIPGIDECLGGGDFTGLVESFGVARTVHAFGMAAGVDRLIRASMGSTE